MRLVITGGGGMLAQDLVRVAEPVCDDVVALDRSALDITEPYDVAEAIADLKPDVVVNCAAYTDVDGAESDEAAATLVNGEGAGNVAGAAANAGAWTVHISTDYVFDGGLGRPYEEDHPARPQSAYGRSKLAGERAVAAAAPGNHTIVRASWLFGTGGSCFPDTIMRLAADRPQIKVVDDQIGSPTFTGHLAEAIVSLSARRIFGVAHVVGGGQCSWYEFAREIVNRSGLDCEVNPCSTAEFPRPAARPAYSVMRNSRESEGVPDLAPWQDGLADYLAARVR